MASSHFSCDYRLPSGAPVTLSRVKTTMTLSEFEMKRCEKLVAEFVQKRRPPPHLRAKVDLAFRISGQSIEIFHIRPYWMDESRKIEEPIAKATYNKSKLVWKIFWMRADAKWHRYPPDPEVASVEEFLDVVQQDDHNCFFG
jgi:hypothetical protein